MLPFVNLSDDREQEYFADGMVEDIIAGLSRLRWLTVIARNSTYAYKGNTPNIRQVAADLGVRYVLEGSVRRAGDRLRVPASWSTRAPVFAFGLSVTTDRQPTYSQCRTRYTENVVASIEPHLYAAGEPALPKQAPGEHRRLGLCDAGDAPNLDLGRKEIETALPISNEQSQSSRTTPGPIAC